MAYIAPKSIEESGAFMSGTTRRRIHWHL